MSINSAMYTGAAGLTSHSEAMGIIGDNIANVNTVGFRGSRANFSDILGGMVAGSRTGLGSQIGSIQTMFNSGALLGTGNSTDLAIQGDGFFVVAGNNNGVSGNHYTRAGQFQMDESGYVVTPAGLRLQGFTADAAGNVGTTLGDMQISRSTLPPVASSEINVVANLDASQAVDATAFDITDPGSTSDYATSLTVYDSVGTPHQISLFFKKTADAPNATWDVHVAAAGSDVSPAVAQDYTELGSGTLTFGTDGSLTSSTMTPVAVQWAGAAAATLDLNVGSPTATGGSGVDGITGYDGASGASALSQDGSTSGEFAGFEIAANGNVVARYTQGQSRVLGQIGTATFASNEGLQRAGDSMFLATDASGQPVMGTPGAAGHGSLVAGSLEASNVDLAHEFVTMMSVQRGFQGNSRTITTADDMLTEIVQLKR